jgi:hypothetical protein
LAVPRAAGVGGGASPHSTLAGGDVRGSPLAAADVGTARQRHKPSIDSAWSSTDDRMPSAVWSSAGDYIIR